MKYTLYTDGATTNNGREGAFGGWAWALYVDGESEPLKRFNSGRICPATNNICEMTAILEGCKYVESIMEGFDEVTVYSDSAYCINCYKQNWYKAWQKNGWKTSAKTPVKNKKKWEELIHYFEHYQFKFEKVKGHSTDKRNCFVDELAVKAKFLEE